MELEVKKPKTIEDGAHDGVITAVEYRQQPYEYTDIVIEFDSGIQLKAGYPTFVNENSKLGQLLKRFGFVVAEGLKVDPDKLVGKKCSFMTMQEETSKGKFAKIIPKSVKPSGEQAKTEANESVDKLNEEKLENEM